MILTKIQLALAKLAARPSRRGFEDKIVFRHSDAFYTDGHVAVMVVPNSIPDESPDVEGGFDRELLKAGTSKKQVKAPALTLRASSCLEALKAIGLHKCGLSGVQSRTHLDAVGGIAVRHPREGIVFGGFSDIDGQPNDTYPNLESVIPKSKPSAEFFLSAALLGQVLKFFEENIATGARGHGPGASAVRFTVYEEGKPIRIDGVSPASDKIMAMIMTCRGGIGGLLKRPHEDEE